MLRNMRHTMREPVEKRGARFTGELLCLTGSCVHVTYTRKVATNCQHVAGDKLPTMSTISGTSSSFSNHLESDVSLPLTMKSADGTQQTMTMYTDNRLLLREQDSVVIQSGSCSTTSTRGVW